MEVGQQPLDPGYLALWVREMHVTPIKNLFTPLSQDLVSNFLGVTQYRSHWGSRKSIFPPNGRKMVSLTSLLRSALLLLLLIYTSAAVLTPGPLVTITTSSSTCSGSQCVDAFYNVPNQCNPIWSTDGDVKEYVKFSETCSMSAGFFSTTRYDDANCTTNPRVRIHALTSVGSDFAYGSQIRVKCDGGSSSAAEKPFIHIEAEGLYSVTVSNSEGCVPIYVGGFPNGTYARLTSTCRNDDIFVSMTVHSTSSCVSSGSTIWDLSAVLNSDHPYTWRPDISVTGSCHGNLAGSSAGSDGVILYQTFGQFDFTTYFRNGPSDSCVPAIYPGIQAAPSKYAKIAQPCSTNDKFYILYLHDTSSCNDSTPVVFSSALDKNVMGLSGGKMHCATKRATPTTYNLVFLNISLDSGSTTYSYAIPNVPHTCHPAYHLDTRSQYFIPDFYIKFVNDCYSNPLFLLTFGIYSDDLCSTAIRPSLQGITGITNMASDTTGYDLSCESAPLAHFEVATIAIEVLGEGSCVDNTSWTGIHRTLYVQNFAGCNGVYSLEGQIVQWIYLEEEKICLPGNEFLEARFYGAACNGDAIGAEIPLGSKRCFNRPDGDFLANGGRAVRARCSASGVGSALGYIYVEQFAGPNADCLSAEPSSTLVLPQDTSICYDAPMWPGSNYSIQLSQLCGSEDPIINFKIFSDGCGGSSSYEYAWLTTRHLDGSTAAGSNYSASSSVDFPSQCNVLIVDGNTVFTKVTCFGRSGSKLISSLALTSGSETKIYAASDTTDPCYNTVKTYPSQSFSSLKFEHLCSPKDVLSTYRTSDLSSCADLTASSVYAEIGKPDEYGVTLSCFQNPASNMSSDAFIDIETFSGNGDGSCGEPTSFIRVKNQDSVCQSVGSSASLVVVAFCYEDDPFLFLRWYRGSSSCIGSPEIYQLRQGGFCNSGSSFSLKARCRSPHMPESPVTFNAIAQSKIWLTLNSESSRSSVIIENNFVDSSLCRAAYNLSGHVVFYTKLTSGKCSKEDAMIRMSLFNDSSCSSASAGAQLALRTGSDIINIDGTSNYTVECHSGKAAFEPNPQSFLFRRAHSDSGCTSPLSRTWIINDLPNTCVPVLYPSSSVATLWAKSAASCHSPSTFSAGSMKINFYTSNTCSESSRFAITSTVFPTAFNASSLVCNTNDVFNPYYASSVEYHCLKTRTYTGPCPGISPGASFGCVNGTWVAPGSVTQPTITVSSGSSVVVAGNLTSSEIIISSIGSTLSVEGCLYLNGSIIVSLTDADIRSLTSKGKKLTLIVYSNDSSCAGSVDLSDVSVTIKSNTGCKRLTSSN